MDAVILCVGTELTDGHIVNTNAPWLAEQLRGIGVRVREHRTIDDQPVRIAETVRQSIAAANLVVITGGLGPTVDDCTRTALEAAIGDVTFALDEPRYRAAKEAYDKRYGGRRELKTGSFIVPTSGHVFDNPVGVALGFAIRLTRSPQTAVPWSAEPLAPTEAVVAVLPGVPREMKAMTEASLRPMVRALRPGTDEIHTRYLRVALPESAINEACEDLLSRPDPDASITLDEEAGFVVLRFSTADADAAAAAARLDEVTAAARDRLGANIYSEQADGTLSGALADLLRERELTIACAESCTAGLATRLLGRHAGVSAVLKESVVTYSDEAKISRLHVPSHDIAEHGAVSEPVARAMAEGIVHTAGVDVGVAITGIAGPDGGTPDKPVGLVHFAVCINERVARLSNPDQPAEPQTIAFHRIIPGDRVSVQLRAAQTALDLARRAVLGAGLPVY